MKKYLYQKTSRGLSFLKMMIVFSLVFILQVSEHYVCADEADVIRNIDEVEINVEKAFILIKDIEIPMDSDIFSELNRVIGQLSDAKFALISEDYDLAFSKSETALTMSEDVFGRANELYVQAVTVERTNIRDQDLMSGGFILLVILSGFFSWRYVEKRHHEEMLKKRPELV